MHEYSNEDRRDINRVTKIMAHFQGRAKEAMSIQLCRTFLAVALYPGLSLREYCKLLGQPQSTVSRQLLDLGDRTRNKEEGFKLIQYTKTHEDIRKNSYTLTKKGEALISAILSELRK